MSTIANRERPSLSFFLSVYPFFLYFLCFSPGYTWTWTLWDLNDTKAKLMLKGEALCKSLQESCDAKPGMLVAILNPVLLEANPQYDSRCVAVDKLDHLLIAGRVEGVMRCGAVTKRHGMPCGMLVYTPTMGDFCKYHVSSREAKARDTRVASRLQKALSLSQSSASSSSMKFPSSSSQSETPSPSPSSSLSLASPPPALAPYRRYPQLLSAKASLPSTAKRRHEASVSTERESPAAERRSLSGVTEVREEEEEEKLVKDGERMTMKIKTETGETSIGGGGLSLRKESSQKEDAKIALLLKANPYLKRANEKISLERQKILRQKTTLQASFIHSGSSLKKPLSVHSSSFATLKRHSSSSSSSTQPSSTTSSSPPVPTTSTKTCVSSSTSLSSTERESSKSSLSTKPPSSSPPSVSPSSSPSTGHSETPVSSPHPPLTSPPVTCTLPSKSPSSSSLSKEEESPSTRTEPPPSPAIEKNSSSTSLSSSLSPASVSLEKSRQSMSLSPVKTEGLSMKKGLVQQAVSLNKMKREFSSHLLHLLTEEQRQALKELSSEFVRRRYLSLFYEIHMDEGGVCTTMAGKTASSSNSSGRNPDEWLSSSSSLEGSSSLSSSLHRGLLGELSALRIEMKNFTRRDFEILSLTELMPPLCLHMDEGVASLALSIWRGAHFRLQSTLNQADHPKHLEKTHTSRNLSEGGGVRTSLDENSSSPHGSTSHISTNRIEAVNRRLAKDSIDVKEAFKKHREEVKKRQRLEQQRERLLEKSSFPSSSFKAARKSGMDGGGLSKRMKTEGGENASSSLYQSSAAGGGGGGLKNFEEDKDKQKKVLEKILSVRSTIQEHVDKADYEEEQETLRLLEKQDVREEYRQSIKEIPLEAFYCVQCNEFSDKLNPVCKSSGHTIERRKTVKRFFKCPECTYTPIVAIGHTLPDGCPRCRAALAKLLLPAVSAYKPKAIKPLPNETLTITGDDEDPRCRSRPVKPTPDAPEGAWDEAENVRVRANALED
ncbi:mcm10 replication factor [Cystoisospora suis]|uniref:Mcm10 replication factor n=1 Tax=Cystoisospora suis TaxID=483139 RepID=A0A2C6LB58_9APIC|nr:mcm10 replication factor [Cystoisospora suis]